MKPKKKINVTEQKANEKEILTLFILFFPTVIIALIPNDFVNIWLAIALKTLIAFYQFIVLRNFIRTYFE
jgi:hypothetical protein